MTNRTYQETLDWMFQQLPMYQREGKTAFTKNLKNITEFDNRLDNPHQSFKTIHVAGTNGKGSVTHMLASVLQEAGYKVGIYTSPHLKDFRERIKVNGTPCPEKFVTKFIGEHESFLTENKLSFFEMTVGMALQYFKEKRVSIAIIETGLGGRLDSTNIINPLLSIITNVDYDHTDILGETISEIALEKAGIIKRDIPVIVGQSFRENHQEVIKAIKPVAKGKGAMMMEVEKKEEPKKVEPKIDPKTGKIKVPKPVTVYSTDLEGFYQNINLETALKAINYLKILFTIEEDDIDEGLKNVVDNTGLRGRWETLSQNPLTIVDTGHNKAAMTMIGHQLKKQDKFEYHMVLGFSQGKDLEGMINELPKNSIFYFAKPNVPRGLNPEEVKETFDNLGLEYQIFDSISSAYQAAQDAVTERDMIFVGGSNFAVAEVL